MSTNFSIISSFNGLCYSMFFLYNNRFYKNRETQNCQKIKIILRIVLRLKASDLIRIWSSSLKNLNIVKGEWFLEVLLFSTQNLIKSVCVVHASEPCFELRAVKSKPSYNACDFDPRDSYKKDSYKKGTVHF